MDFHSSEISFSTHVRRQIHCSATARRRGEKCNRQSLSYNAHTIDAHICHLTHWSLFIDILRLFFPLSHAAPTYDWIKKFTADTIDFLVIQYNICSPLICLLGYSYWCRKPTKKISEFCVPGFFIVHIFGSLSSQLVVKNWWLHRSQLQCQRARSGYVL